MPQHNTKVRLTEALTGNHKSNCLRTSALGLLTALLAIAAPAQTFTSLVSFSGYPTNGQDPVGPLVQGLDGRFYGFTSKGGVAPNNKGTFLAITAQGKLTTLHSFRNAEAAFPQSGLLILSDGKLYGTANSGGANTKWGSVFSVSPTGIVTVLHSFNLSDGANPLCTLAQGFNGMLYGTTSGGGASSKGTVFQITPSGTFTTVHSFSGSDGYFPVGGLLQASTGLLYGTAQNEVYSLGLTGLFNVVSRFSSSNPGIPQAALIGGPGMNFYGTAVGGAVNDGSVFEVTPTGSLTILYNFTGPDGSMPYGSLVLGTDGNFYGVTQQGGDRNGDGTIFQVTSSGALTTLHMFNRTDGSGPFGGLVQGTDGNFYGTTGSGGTSGNGTIFKLSMGLAPFVRSVPGFGTAGASVAILGNRLKGATSVTFNGVAASFTVKSGAYIKATVPSGATTGTIEVVTPSGTLKSNVPFQVL